MFFVKINMLDCNFQCFWF